MACLDSRGQIWHMSLQSKSTWVAVTYNSCHNDCITSWGSSVGLDSWVKAIWCRNSFSQVEHKYKINLCCLASWEIWSYLWLHRYFWQTVPSLHLGDSWTQTSGKTKNFPIPLEFTAVRLFFSFATSWINFCIGIKIITFACPSSECTEFFPNGISWGFGTFFQSTQQFSICIKVSCYLFPKPSNPKIAWVGRRLISSCQSLVSSFKDTSKPTAAWRTSPSQCL